ncbi:MAG: tetraacyldisaccharide 4'-kinase [Candidatus Cloacimonetes bacterium]|nr:tetraacyldisaccharide 4'-kinase [Candidatus Cloacimonadota bacterium]
MRANLHCLIQTHLLKRSPLSYLLYPLGRVYSAYQALRRRRLYPRPYHAPCKVISIGNIVSGGSGKTPLTIAIARLLSAQGLRVAVSHRGYKGKFENNPHLISDSKSLLFPADVAGDEAYLIASSLPGIPVVVGRKRKDAIRLLLQSYPNTQVLIMDDSFQHLKVFRDLDIVSFSTESGIGNGFVLPAGYLRESLDTISDKCVAVVYRRQQANKPQAWETALHAKTPYVFHSYATASECVDTQGNPFAIDTLKGKRLVLVSGIAHPKSFQKTVKELGLSFIKHYMFPDHHGFDDEELVSELLHELPDIILCTQKDIMKLARHPELAPRLRALVLGYHFDEEQDFQDLITTTLS